MSDKSWWEATLETVGDLGKSVSDGFFGAAQAESQNQAQLNTEKAQQSQAAADSAFWQRFAIISAIAVGSLVVLKVTKVL